MCVMGDVCLMCCVCVGVECVICVVLCVCDVRVSFHLSAPQVHPLPRDGLVGVSVFDQITDIFAEAVASPTSLPCHPQFQK